MKFCTRIQMTATRWLQLTKIYAKPLAERNEEELWVTVNSLNGYRLGLCDAMMRLWDVDYEDKELFWQWGHKLGWWRKYKKFWGWPLTDDGDLQRSHFCILMWAIGTEEYRKLVGG